MWLRRAFYYAQFWAIPVLPLWLLVARGLSIGDAGWELIVLLFATPALILALIVVLGITVARTSVRRARLLSWQDVGVLTLWYITIVVAGVIAHPVAAVGVVIVTLVAFWSAAWQLVAETRRRVNSALAAFTAATSGERHTPADGVRVIRVQSHVHES